MRVGCGWDERLGCGSWAAAGMQMDAGGMQVGCGCGAGGMRLKCGWDAAGVRV